MLRPREFRTAIVATVILAFLVGLGCAGRILQFDKSEDVLRNDEYEKKVAVKEAPNLPPPPAPVVSELPIVEKAVGKKTKKGTKTVSLVVKPKGPRQPELEDAEGFDGRLPVKNPFRVGEKVTFDISYFNVSGGQLEMGVGPMVSVNGQSAYNFIVSAKSYPNFSRFVYAIDDQAITYVTHDELVPLNLQISLKESKQLAETRTFFDWKTMKANYWQKQVTKEKGERSKKMEWDIPPYSQNVISVAYYLRTFKLEPGKKLAIRVADEGKNIIFTGEVLRREKLKTPVGVLDTVVIRPQVTADGVFKPIGEILIWMTDDDRKFIVRLESKIKIGTVVAKLKSIEKGQD